MASDIKVLLGDGKVKFFKGAEAEIGYGFLIVKENEDNLVIYPEHEIKRVEVVKNA